MKQQQAHMLKYTTIYMYKSSDRDGVSTVGMADGFNFLLPNISVSSRKTKAFDGSF